MKRVRADRQPASSVCCQDRRCDRGGRAAWLRLAALIATIAVASAGFEQRAGGQEKPKPLQGFDEATLTAWKKAGAKVGWLGKKKFGAPGAGGLHFMPQPDEQEAPVPAFKLPSGQEKLLAGLPAPTVPFGLDFYNSPVTDEGLKQLARFQGLQSLHFGSTKVGDAGLKELAPLKDLQALDLRSTLVTDAGLKELAGFKTLRLLILASTKLTDAGMKELADLKNLRSLNLNGTQVSDLGLKELAGLKNLQTLTLPSQVTDTGLKQLAGLKGLQALDLANTRVTDAGLKELAGLKNLQSLILSKTKVTETGVAELKKAIPACQIVR